MDIAMPLSADFWFPDDATQKVERRTRCEVTPLADGRRTGMLASAEASVQFFPRITVQGRSHVG